MEKQVNNFIHNFKALHPKEIEESFLYGNCYWFAHILTTRFDGDIVYLPIENHFLALIDQKFYDISGKVEPTTKWVYWTDFQRRAPLESKRIIKQCIEKKEQI